VYGDNDIDIGFWWRNLKERVYWEDLDTDDSTMLKLIFMK
jgi:hypothetical protein